MKKSGKFLKKGLSFLMVLVLAFTSVFFNRTPINAEVIPDQIRSGANLEMTLVDITGGGYRNKPASDSLELFKGEKYTLKVRLGYQDEPGTGLSKMLITVKNGEIIVYRNGIEKTRFGKLITSVFSKNSTDVKFDFVAGEESTPDEFGKISDYILAKGKTGIVNHEIILSSSLEYKLKLKAEFYLEDENGKEQLYKTEKLDWNANVPELDAPTILGKNFIGWYDKSTNDKFDFTKPITDNVKLVAKYEYINNGEQQEEENKENVTVTFKLDDKSEEVIIYKGDKFSDARNDQSIRFNDLKKMGEQYVTNKFDAMEYDWYTDSNFENKVDDEVINSNTTYYATTKVKVTFQVGSEEKGNVTIEKGKTFTDAKGLLENFDDFDKYDWYKESDFQNKVNETEEINENTIYYGDLKIKEVYVTFYVNDTKNETVTIEKGKTFTDANAAAVKNGFDTSEYEWFEDEQFTKPAVDEPILEEKIYYGRLITQKVKVTFFVNKNTKQDVVVPMGTGFEFSKKLVKTFDVSEYEWFEDEEFKKPAVNEPILAEKTYYGRLITQKVKVTFFVNENNKQDVVVPMGTGFEFSKKLVDTLAVNEYEWFEDNTFNTPAVVNEP
ncbi:MAG: InlB B-repeat-containing protein, partial [Catonella sp.]|uniref:InlB B-repeat-containing protein n=1 Tax=Catonella sp. TaxID=2382125 RepID=UPI003FA01BF4